MEPPCAMVAFVLRGPGDLELQKKRELPVSTASGLQNS